MIVSAPVPMVERDTLLAAEVSIARRGGLEEVEAEDMGGSLAKAPEWCQLLPVQTV